MIASKFFLHIYLLLILACVPCIFTSTLEFNFPVCSETHVKAEYALQDPTPCKTHISHLTRQCNVNVLNVAGGRTVYLTPVLLINLFHKSTIHLYPRRAF